MCKMIVRVFEFCTERWQSGLMYYLGKVACEKSHRGFESPSLRSERSEQGENGVAFAFSKSVARIRSLIEII